MIENVLEGLALSEYGPFNGTFTRFKRESFPSYRKTCFPYVEITLFCSFPGGWGTEICVV